MKKILLMLFIVTSMYAQSYHSALESFKASSTIKRYFNDAYGYALFPTIGKGGMLFGFGYGRGKLYHKNDFEGRASISSFSFGPQMGGQAYSAILFFKDRATFEAFKRGRVEYDAEVNAIAITAGAIVKSSTIGTIVSASTNAANTKVLAPNYINNMAIFVQPLEGLMFEASIGFESYHFKAE